MRIHVVKSGDTLWQIAQAYGVDINQIIYLNQPPSPDVLVIGQSLVIPEPSREYVVMPGDNLWAISQRYGVTINELAAANSLTDPSRIMAGEMLINPYSRYMIQPGDTLWEVADRFDVSTEELIVANNITNPSLIYAGQIIRIPFPDRPIKEINAYTTQINPQGAQEVTAFGRNFTYLSPFMYAIREDGSITERQDQPLLQAAESQNIAPLLTLTNFKEGSFDSDLAAAVLRNESVQETLITNLLNEIQSKGYQGINIDFEYIYPEDKENYNNFLRRLTAQFHPAGLLVSTALAPKIKEDQTGLLYEAHDYRAQGEIVDFIVLMTYEWGWAGGEPWAIAPINKVREVLDFAVTVIPRDKIVMGIPLYGRDWKIPWVQGTFARTVSPQEAVSLAARYGVPIQYDEKYQSPYFFYTDESGQKHEVWFEDARSMQEKYDTIKAYDLRGGSYWVLGNPFPQNWPVLQSNFQIRKL
ncbi:LysM peptidoglycan-binding domain-containing protein [Halobacillus sp. Marseille-Q1614]|uniref:LysM peptidoglycan-binding domain-containing protein n=1 Tax=Halobacillus sp. Marseille-Q1614 TaxID=2709134 RepID=UPI001570CB08|nr:LysM peptidoglycan-binding domain-containing protein [Halobacillus sp. Marseille-Q1614]